MANETLSYELKAYELKTCELKNSGLENYKYDENYNYYVNSKNFSLPYSDGDETEKYVYEIVKNANDKFEFSKELRSAIKDWASFYYFSPIRNNIFRPITKYLKGIGLEAGCGMGALTNFLASNAKMLYALEGSKARAKVTAERAKGLQNVKVLVDDIMNVALRDLDFITLIGVLEYAGCFAKNANPYLTMLKTLKASLKDDGFLIIAIENKLGLKYIAGAKEDHLGTVYTGIEDCYKEGTAKTFTKQALIAMLKEAGFEGLEFYYPFPDYKQPKVVVHERALVRDDFNVSQFIMQGIKESFPQDFSNIRNFSEEAVWRVLSENKNVGDFANSFLIVATKEAKNFQKYVDDDLAFSYSAGRDKEFASEVKIVANKGKLIVKRRNLYPKDSKNQNLIVTQTLQTEDYIEGKSYFETILPILNTPNFTLDDIATWAMPWISYLSNEVVKNSDTGELLVSQKFLDCTPTNLIIRKDNKIYPFDFEWQCQNEYIPLLWVIFRGFQNVFTSITSVAFSKEIIDKSIGEIIWNIITMLGFNINESDVSLVYMLESQLQTDTMGFLQDIRGYLNNPLLVRKNKEWYETKISELCAIIYQYDEKLKKLEQGLNA
ncbi:MAG: class I SAM-dependent methyltransferase [Bdellovibrionota bacterium]